jgi:hypothetical protein
MHAQRDGPGPSGRIGVTVSQTWGLRWEFALDKKCGFYVSLQHPHLFQYVETLLNQNIPAYHHILKKESKDVPVRALEAYRGSRGTALLIL